MLPSLLARRALSDAFLVPGNLTVLGVAAGSDVGPVVPGAGVQNSNRHEGHQ